MFRSSPRCLMALMVICCLSSTANAETLTLLSGQKIEGQVIERTELRVIVDVQGIPKTFFLGEIASIDGKKIEMPQEQAVNKALAEIKKTRYNEEQNSLVKILNKSKTKATATSNANDHKDSKLSSPTQVAALHPVVLPLEKSVVSTPDGGIIVVSHEKITKYDKNLNIVKAIDLKPDDSASTK